MPTNPYEPPTKDVQSKHHLENPSVGRHRSVLRYLMLTILGLLLSAAGYIFFAVVVAIYVGLWLQADKMYYAQYPWYHLFGAVGAALGMLFTWVAWRMTRRRS
jgi:uncharacterized membrane protein